MAQGPLVTLTFTNIQTNRKECVYLKIEKKYKLKKVNKYNTLSHKNWADWQKWTKLFGSTDKMSNFNRNCLYFLSSNACIKWEENHYIDKHINDMYVTKHRWIQKEISKYIRKKSKCTRLSVLCLSKNTKWSILYKMMYNVYIILLVTKNK